MRQHRSPWLNNDIRDFMIHRDNVAKLTKRDNCNTSLFEDLKRLKRQRKSRIRSEAKAQGLIALSSKNPKDPWKFIKEVTFTATGTNDNHNYFVNGIKQLLRYNYYS